MELPGGLLYTAEHEWLQIAGDRGTIGITDYAQDQLGDIVYVELPEPGSRLESGAVFGVVESVKTVSDLYAPVSGEVLERNERLEDEPELVNAAPYGEAWMLRLRIEDPAQLESLLSPEAYEELTRQEQNGG
ncbi:MAG: glycine cleavage system protein GcvH [Chloroflexi bacterium]|nr:glycine cleavage system protein GcvH [Chloroflexota bacterium]